MDNGFFAAWAARIFSQPLLAEPWAAACVLGVLADRLGIATVSIPDLGMDDTALDVGFLAGVAQDFQREQREYHVTNDGMAVIPIQGALMRRSASLKPRSGAVGYNAIEEASRQAMADGQVKGLLFDIDSSGGESAGCLEAARFISSLRGQKPMWSVASPQACSAAYALASATDRVITSQQGDVGSIGVLGIHVDRSGELSSKGHKVTIFQKGARKAEGHPFGTLSEDAVKNIDGRLEGLFGSFVDLTCSNRNLTPQHVRSLEGATFGGDEAKKMGLVDAVMDPRDATAEFRQHLNDGARSSVGVSGMNLSNIGASNPALASVQGSSHILGHIILGPAEGGQVVRDNTVAGQLQGTTIVTFTQADLDKARADGVAEGKRLAEDGVSQNLAVAKDTGIKQGMDAERARIAAILDSDEAKDRPSFARHVAFKTSMVADEAISFLGAAASEVQAEPAKAPRVDAQARLHLIQNAPNPQLGPSDMGGEQDEEQALLANLRKLEGRK